MADHEGSRRDAGDGAAGGEDKTKEACEEVAGFFDSHLGR